MVLHRVEHVRRPRREDLPLARGLCRGQKPGIRGGEALRVDEQVRAVLALGELDIEERVWFLEYHRVRGGAAEPVTVDPVRAVGRVVATVEQGVVVRGPFHRVVDAVHPVRQELPGTEIFDV